MIRSWLNLCLALLTAGGFYGQQAAQGSLLSSQPVPGSDAISGSYTITVENYDWGAAVSGAVVKLERPVTNITPEQFLVVEEKQAREDSSADLFATNGGLTLERTVRTVSAAYLCDQEGSPTGKPSQFIALEFAVSPETGSPLCLQQEQPHYTWANPYRLVIELAQGQTITSSGKAFSRLAISRTPTRRIFPLTEQYSIQQHTADGQTLSYLSHTPSAQGGNHPLLIWLHGLGEGGSAPEIPLTAGRLDIFTDTEFQTSAGGCYVLVPQCPTFWLDDGSSNSTQTGKSCYTAPLLSLIRQFIADHPDIDPQRVYVGGCSNGGYMTIALLLEAPELFAAAFPVCQAYENRWLDDADIQTLTQIPLWFVHSQLDRICPPEYSTFPIVERLQAAGASQVRLTRLDTVQGSTGTEETACLYNPHYAWIPVLGGQCSDSGQTLFQWLVQQRRTQ